MRTYLGLDKWCFGLWLGGSLLVCVLLHDHHRHGWVWYTLYYLATYVWARVFHKHWCIGEVWK